MAGRVFYTDNDTDGLADVLKAVGAAQGYRAWLRVLGRDAEPITIVNKGPYHQITLPTELDESEVERVRQWFLAGAAKVLVSKRIAEKAAQEGRTQYGIFDYEAERAKREAYVKQYQALPRADLARFETAPEFEELRRSQPDAYLPLYTYINHFKVADGYNALVEQWRGSENLATFHANLRFLLRAFSEYPNPLDEAVAGWEAEIEATGSKGKALLTRLQLVNPASGKGANAPKTGNLSVANLDGFWLLEYLKFVGLFTLGVPLMLKGVKDRKTYVLRPTEVDLNKIEGVMDAFRKRLFATTAVKTDIVASLRFTVTLLEYLRDAMMANQPDPHVSILRRRGRQSITNIAHGFDVAFYKDMGSAYATMNLATVNLPSWLGPTTTVAEAEAALKLLKEHLDVISGIRTAKGDEGSEEYELLRRYRDFLSGHDLAGFLDFAALYGDYLLAKLHRNQWAGQFTTEGLDTLMSQQFQRFTPIIENDGFRAIAAAIRSATVRAQFSAARDRGYPYEVRYGLGQELLRAAAYPETFLAALGTFIQSYNTENARIDERIAKGSLNAPRRPSVRTDHLDQLVRLIDEYRSTSANGADITDMICKLLLAYGYARDPRVPDNQPGTPPTGPDDELDDSLPA